ncbi:AP-2 complex subunit mu, partial [Tanacetum coccineum]
GNVVDAFRLHIMQTKAVNLFKSYFGGGFDEDVIRNIFVLIYELLVEFMDFGYPQNASPEILKLYITRESVRSPFSSKPTDKPVPNATLQVTGAVGWRREGLHYKKNEVFLDIVGSFNLLILSSIMSGHKSVVSTLAVCSEVLYGGSWDGTIRLWCVSDHSPLVVLGEEAPIHGSILSLAAHTHTIVGGHENRCTKVSSILTLTNSLTMINDVPLSPISAHPSSIFSIYKEGQRLYKCGWNVNVVVQVIPLPSNIKVKAYEWGQVVAALVSWKEW